MKDYELDEKIGKRLAECMKSAKINGSTLAQEANKYYSMHNLASTKNMSQQKISTIVNGRVHLKKEDAELFAKILNVNLDYLLLESEYMTLDANIKDIAQTGVDELMSFFLLWINWDTNLLFQNQIQKEMKYQCIETIKIFEFIKIIPMNKFCPKHILPLLYNIGS